MPTDPFAPIWKGTTGITERLGSPVWEFSVKGAKVTRTYDGQFTALLAARPGIGALMSDTGYLQVATVKVVPDGGGAGVMTVVLEIDSQGPTYDQVAAPVYEIDWVEVQKDITRHPRYQAGGDTPLSADEFKRIKLAREGDQDSIDYLTGETDDDPVKQLWNKILAGNEDYIDFIPVVTSTLTSYSRPSAVNDGAGFPDYPPDAAGAPTGWVWLRTACPTVREGAKWKVKYQWTGARWIDPDIYPDKSSDGGEA